AQACRRRDDGVTARITGRHPHPRLQELAPWRRWRSQPAAGTAPTADAGFRYRIRPLPEPGSDGPGYPDGADVTGGVTMLPLSRRFKAAGNVQSGQLLRA